jgi:hypothetical protein
VLNVLEASLLVDVAIPFAWPETVIGTRKLPVNAARSAGDVKTVVCTAELLVTAGNCLPLVPASFAVPSNGEALNDSVTDGIESGSPPVGTLIVSSALEVPSIVLADDPRFSAEKLEL